ncbi:MAG: class I SAM-dependent methyltransferase [bacterium]
MNDWYKKSFGLTYLELYSHRDKKEAQRDIERLVRFLTIPKDECLLDLCCGAGRHLLALHKIGFRRLIGLDLSKELLHSAQRELSKAGAHHIKLLCKDMREIPFQNYFGAIFSLFTSFGYFENDEENQKVISRVRQALRPKGIFVLDYLNKEYGVKNLVAEDVKKLKDRHIKNTRRLSNDKKRIEKKISIFKENGEEQIFYESVRLYGAKELENILHVCGFRNIKRYGSLGGETFHSDSKRLIFVCEK